MGGGSMTFGQAISSGFQNYVNFQGRAQRSAYWWWVLFAFIVGFVLGFIRGLLGLTSGPGMMIMMVTVVFQLAILLPSIGLAVRRLHDTGRSGWWVLISITIIGIIPLIIWYCTPGQPGENKYGRNPLEPDVQTVF